MKEYGDEHNQARIADNLPINPCPERKGMNGVKAT